MKADRFTVKGGTIHFGKKVIGDAGLLFVDYNELVGVEDVEHVTMPRRIDGVMAVDGRVIGIESKKPEDLLNSFLVRRLKRQLDTLLAVTDTPVLLIRGPIGELVTYDGDRNKVVWDYKELAPLYKEIVRWQALGAFVLQGPAEPELVPAYLDNMRDVIGGGRNVLVAVSGTDQHRETERRRGWLLRRIPGIGAKTSQRLHSAFGSTLSVLSAHPDDLEDAGANRSVVKSISEAIK